jgi:hypothetical protein
MKVLLLSLCFILFILLLNKEYFQWGSSGPIIGAYMDLAASQNDPLSRYMYSF